MTTTIDKTPPLAREALIELMAHVDLLSSLSSRDLRTLADYCAVQHARAGAVIFREGDRGDSLFLLASGAVRIQKEDDSRHMHTIAEENRSRAIGEMSLLDGEPRSATCVALVQSTLLVLSHERLDRLARSHPDLAYRLITAVARLVSRRLRLTSGRLVDSLA